MKITKTQQSLLNKLRDFLGNPQNFTNADICYITVNLCTDLDDALDTSLPIMDFAYTYLNKIHKLIGDELMNELCSQTPNYELTNPIYPTK